MRKKEVLKEEISKETYKMAYLFGLFYYHFAKVLVDELGNKKGRELITKAVKNFAIERGRKMREQALKMNIELTRRNLRKVSDLPAHTFYTDGEGTHCPFADVWKEKGPLGQELGLLYCNVNDPQKEKAFNPELRLYRYIKNRNLGDITCDSANVEYLE
jgi:hypothetical protein